MKTNTSIADVFVATGNTIFLILFLLLALAILGQEVLNSTALAPIS
jgi:preprotein translocase subunit SecF